MDELLHHSMPIFSHLFIRNVIQKVTIVTPNIIFSVDNSRFLYYAQIQ